MRQRAPRPPEPQELARAAAEGVNATSRVEKEVGSRALAPLRRHGIVEVRRRRMHRARSGAAEASEPPCEA